MAVLYYLYLLLKIPIEKGILSLRGNVVVAYNCETESYQTTEAFDLSIRIQESIADAKKIPLVDLEIPHKEAPRGTTKSKEFKEIELVLGDKTKLTRIGLNLDPK